MNTQVKEMWLEALEGGEYMFGKLKLKTIDCKYCGIGVLCDLYRIYSGSWARWTKSNNSDRFKFETQTDSTSASLPLSVRQWAELDEDAAIQIADYNDRSTNFSVIINYIKTTL